MNLQLAGADVYSYAPDEDKMVKELPACVPNALEVGKGR